MGTDDVARTAGMDAVAVRDQLAAGRLAPTDLLRAVVQRHDAVDGAVNALPTLCTERAEARAESYRGRGPLHGLPVAVKDMTRVAGVRTTYGSPLFADHVPEASDYIVEQLEDAGGLVFAKSNTPEFACGGVTFNSLFGDTRNPWDLAYTAGGSSGGSAAALASGQAWFALGTDFGGSLRIPASFCGVIGFRPSPGVLPRGPTVAPFDRDWIDGPMARTVTDTRLLFDALRGRQWRDPLSLGRSATFGQGNGGTGGLRIANAGGMGMGAVEPGVQEAVDGALATLTGELDWTADRVDLDLSGSRTLFAVRRGLFYIIAFDELRKQHPGQVREDIVADLERGLAFTAGEIAAAERERGRLWEAMAAVFEHRDVIVSPTVAVAPFRADAGAIGAINCEPAPTYYDWLKLTYSISMLGVPALSIPCGFSPEGLPIGMQVIGRPYADEQVLDVAERIEACLDVFGGVEVPWQRAGGWTRE